jgi:hypothetical protein
MKNIFKETSDMLGMFVMIFLNASLLLTGIYTIYAGFGVDTFKEFIINVLLLVLFYKNCKIWFMKVKEEENKIIENL